MNELQVQGVTDLASYSLGKQHEQERLLRLLTEQGVIRDGLLGNDWQVIYTQDGAQDITWAELKGESK